MVGTKEQMQKLLKDANEYNKTIGKHTNYQIESYADIVSAIHDIQEKTKVAGTTEKEAMTTLQGSIGALKASWNNFLSGAGDLSQVVSSVDIAFKNILSLPIPAST